MFNCYCKRTNEKKTQVWRVRYTLAKVRKSARTLLTLEEKDPKRLFEGK